MSLVLVQTVGLLCLSNLFMTLAWYGHLKSLGDHGRGMWRRW